jgi:hypothetical protein
VGLDIFVGPLTRYYLGDWESIIQQAARESGQQMEVVRFEEAGGSGAENQQAARSVWPAEVLQAAREAGFEVTADPVDQPTDGGDAVPEPALVRANVLEWRQVLNRQLAAEMSEALDWDESDAAPHFTDKPDWSAYSALQLLAVCADYSDAPLPERLPDDLDEHAAWSRASAEDFAASPYPHLLLPELWLPGDFEFVFRVPEPGSEEPIAIGSSGALFRQLNALNERTLWATPGDLARWSQDGAGSRDKALVLARFGLAVMMRLTEQAMSNRLPMRLDY